MFEWLEIHQAEVLTGLSTTSLSILGSWWAFIRKVYRNEDRLIFIETKLLELDPAMEKIAILENNLRNMIRIEEDHYELGLASRQEILSEIASLRDSMSDLTTAILTFLKKAN